MAIFDLLINGGKIEKGEIPDDAIIREVQEETGYIVKPDSVTAFGEIIERRMAKYEPMIWNQINRLYFCKVEEIQTQCNYSDHEKELGYKLVYKTIDEALEYNKQYLEKIGEKLENKREYQILELIKKSDIQI